MWFFTGKGDAGETTLFDGSRVKKNDPILDLIGAVDELNSFIGLARSKISDDSLSTDLVFLQSSLSKLMGLIAGASAPSLFDFNLATLLEWLEAKILIYSKGIINPNEFTFPGETEIGAVFDICRTVSRRTERIAVELYCRDDHRDEHLLMVFNRLSSYFYILRLSYE